MILTRRCRSKIHSGEERRKSVELKKKREINLLDTTKIKRHKNVENFPNFPMASENTSKSRFCQNLQMKYSEKNQNIAKMGQKKKGIIKNDENPVNVETERFSFILVEFLIFSIISFLSSLNFGHFSK